MFISSQKLLLKEFAECSDELFDKGIIRTDSFIGEIGEYFASKFFDLKKSDKSTKSIDAVDKAGKKYQIKTTQSNSKNFSGLDFSTFDFLIVVFLDENLLPKLIKKTNKKIQNLNSVSINSNDSFFETVEKKFIKISTTEKNLLLKFSELHQRLQKEKIIRSKRIVGDIGEKYASHFLNLNLSENKNESGYDATDDKGLKYEIKCRRIYESGRRKSETRRINNLVGKECSFVVIVILDRNFLCTEIWKIPFDKIENKKSANVESIKKTKDAINVPLILPKGKTINSRRPTKKIDKSFIKVKYRDDSYKEDVREKSEEIIEPQKNQSLFFLFFKTSYPFLIIAILLYRLLVWLNDSHYKEVQDEINTIPRVKIDALPYDSLIKDSIKLLPKDTSKYHGNWIDINQ